MGSNVPGAGESEQHRLQHLIAAVGDEHLLGSDAVQFANGSTQAGRAAVGVSVPIDAGHRRGEGVTKSLWRTNWRLVRVQTNVDRDLGRVVALEGRQVVAHGNTGHDTRGYRTSSRRFRGFSPHGNPMVSR